MERRKASSDAWGTPRVWGKRSFGRRAVDGRDRRLGGMPKVGLRQAVQRATSAYEIASEARKGTPCE